MKCSDVVVDGFYIVEVPPGTRTVWRRETGESWDTGASEPRVMWFDCSDAQGMPMEAVFNPAVEAATVVKPVQLVELQPAQEDHAQQLWTLFRQVAVELRHARAMFPEPAATGYALFEEVGEVAQAILQYKLEGGPATKADVQKEVVQAVAMLCRLWIDGDDSIGLEPIGSTGE